MHCAIRATIAAFVFLAGYADAVFAQEATRQIKLTEKQVEAALERGKGMALDAVVAELLADE